MRKASLILLLILFLAIAVSARGEDHGPPTLALGAAAPDFCLPGIDGQTHCLKEYASSPVLVMIFTCNHCPTAQLYEERIKQLVAVNQGRGVAFVAIEPN